MSPKSRKRPTAKKRRKRPVGSPQGSPPDVAPILIDALSGSLAEQTPLPAEVFVSHFLGMAWSQAEMGRTDAVDELCRLLAEQAGRYGARARPMLEVLSRVGPPRTADVVAAAAQRITGPIPEWVPLLDRVVFVDGFTATDLFGDQTNYVMEFAYTDEHTLVGRHVLVAMVDHNMHLLKDAFVAIADGALAEIRAVFETAPDLVVDSEFDPASAATDIAATMDIADHTLGVSEILGEQTDQVWYLLKARLRSCLPEPSAGVESDNTSAAERAKVVTAFLRSKACKDLVELGVDGRQADRQTVGFLARLFVDYACDYGRGNPLAWSPTAVELFLADYAPRKVVWQDDDAEWVAPTLKVFVDWALKRAGLPPKLRWQTQQAVDEFAGDFTVGVLAGADPMSGKAFVEALLSRGIDPSDDAAIAGFIDEYNRGQSNPPLG